MAATAPEIRVIRRKWNRPQSAFRRIRGAPNGPLIYKDLEGAVGSGKTTAPAWMLVEYATDYPGIHMCIAAWTDEMLGPPKTVFLTAARDAGFSVDAGNLTWHGGQGEDYYQFEGYDSRVYIRSLRASEDDMRYMKLAGLSLSIFWIDQPEPVPEDVFDAYVPARMRQPGYPHEIWLSPNPLDEDHWLSRRFPTIPAHSRPHHHYIHVALQHNAENVGQQFINDMVLAHPPGSANHNLQVAGCRGPSLRGVPVYKGYFDKELHVDPGIEIDPRYPLLEGWDFGEEKPAVSWWQYFEHIAALRVYGSVKGEFLFLEDFAPKVLEIRTRWFPSVPQGVWTWADPTGDNNTSGSKFTGVRILQDHGVLASFDSNANSLPVRNAAIQVIAGFMRRLARDGSPAFLMHPRCIELSKRRDGELEERESQLMVSAFHVGYVWSEHAAPDTNPNIRKPQKGTRYDDLMNSGEYVVIGHKITVPNDAQFIRADKRLAILAARHEEAAMRAAFRATQVGRNNETLEEAAVRIRKMNKINRDYEPSDPDYRGRKRGGVARTATGGYCVVPPSRRGSDDYASGGRRGGYG